MRGRAIVSNSPNRRQKPSLDAVIELDMGASPTRSPRRRRERRCHDLVDAPLASVLTRLRRAPAGAFSHPTRLPGPPPGASIATMSLATSATSAAERRPACPARPACARGAPPSPERAPLRADSPGQLVSPPSRAKLPPAARSAPSFGRARPHSRDRTECRNRRHLHPDRVRHGDHRPRSVAPSS